MFWGWLAITLVFDLVGMTLGKKFTTTQEGLYLLGAILSFAVMGYTMTQMLAFKELAIANVLWAVSISAILIFVGVFYFQEKLSWLQLVGITLCVAGVVLIQWPSK